MREIKFRAWDKDQKRMVKVKSIHFMELESCIVVNPFEFISLEHVELLQYAGLKDKNGVEIYDGDIDQAENGDKNVIVFLLKAGTYCVMPMDIYLNNDYQNEAFSQEFMYGFGYDLFFDNLTPGKYLNIIGNIYENPELLEGNQ